MTEAVTCVTCGQEAWTCDCEVVTVEQAEDAGAGAEYRYRNALEWIRMVAGMHYLGGAFDPEHMRNLANIAADALDGRRDLPDFEETAAKAQRKARKMADEFSKLLADPDKETRKAHDNSQ